MTTFGMDLRLAARNLTRHTRRNAILAGAVAAATALLVLLTGLTGGMRVAMLESATTLMTGHVNVAGFFKITSGTGFPMVTDYEKVLAAVRPHVPELDYVTVRGRGYARVVSDTGSMDLVLAGVDIAAEPGFRRVVRIKDGRLDDLAKPGTILLFEESLKRLGVRVGDNLTIIVPIARGMQNTVDVRVAAVAKNVGILSAFNAFLPTETHRAMYQGKSTNTGAIHLYLRDPKAAPQVAGRLRTVLAAAGWRVMDADPRPFWEKFARVNAEDWVGQKIDVTIWEDEMSFLAWILRALEGLAGLLVTILMVIVVVGIMNTLAIAIRERTREIGTLRAIGMQRRTVLRLFLLEAGLLGAGGAVAGAVAGAAVAIGLNAARITVPDTVQFFLMQQHLTLALTPAAVVGYVAGMTLVTTLAALYPAWHAARLRPVTAMHHIG